MPLDILVIDDDASVRKSLIRLLRMHGHRAFGARDGSDALRQAIERQPAVILLDLLLPEQNGIEIAKVLQAHPTLRHIPVIALSASPGVAENAALFCKVLPKPCPANVLLEAIANSSPTG